MLCIIAPEYESHGDERERSADGDTETEDENGEDDDFLVAGAV
ncbi:hypothetical protein [Halosimplex salinum]|nr:hypothetical protein [Halosimplex salinum]